MAPIILFTVREPQRTKPAKTEKKENEIEMTFGQRLLLLIKTFLYPGMFLLCIAGGIRNAGGYVWAYNTELFFQAQDFSNDQISHFMSWIPLVGGSLGAVFGGFISDLLVKNRSTYVRIWVLIVSQVHIKFIYSSDALIYCSFYLTILHYPFYHRYLPLHSQPELSSSLTRGVSSPSSHQTCLVRCGSA